jgi:hypothetical protein
VGDYEASDRPKTVNPKSTFLSGKAMAVALHLRLMPYFLWCILRGNVIHSPAVGLLVILARILEYIMADKLTLADIENFEELVVDFFEKRAVCAEQYTNFCNMTPKYHHLGMSLYLFVINLTHIFNHTFSICSVFLVFFSITYFLTTFSFFYFLEPKFQPEQENLVT